MRVRIPHIIGTLACCVGLFTTPLSGDLFVTSAVAKPADKGKKPSKRSAPIVIKPTKGAFVGDIIPNFTLKSIKGERVQLKQFRGKHVVIEWLNPACPHVKKHYDSGNMQRLQKLARKKKVVWLAILATNEGQSKPTNVKKLRAHMANHKATHTHILLDPKGKTAKVLKAQTTPHMQVICPKGKLLYTGAIDDVDSTKAADVKRAKNHLVNAINACTSGKQILSPVTVAYGCPIQSIRANKRALRKRNKQKRRDRK